MLHMVCSLIRRRVTRRLTRLQTLYNVLRYRNAWCKNGTRRTCNTNNRNRNAAGSHRTLRQFNNAQYCICSSEPTCI